MYLSIAFLIDRSTVLHKKMVAAQGIRFAKPVQEA